MADEKKQTACDKQAAERMFETLENELTGANEEENQKFHSEKR